MAVNGTDNDRAGLAAEYVLGTLDVAEKAEAERLLLSDESFRNEVAFWESKLTSLLAVVSPVEPPDDILDRVMKEIGPQVPVMDKPVNDNVEQLGRRMRFWRGSAIAASFVAICMMGILAGREIVRPVQDVKFVAVLETGKNEPAFVASIDTAKKVVHVVRLGDDPGADRSYELWAIKPGGGNPQSLGVVDDSRDLGASQLGQLDPAVLQNTTFAVSIEKKGGSTTGLPTPGQVKFIGKLVPLKDLKKK